MSFRAFSPAPPGSLGYAPPELLIEVTPQKQDVALSEHFRLRHFLTKDQAHVWPKYRDAADVWLDDDGDGRMDDIDGNGPFVHIDVRGTPARWSNP